MSFVLDIHQVGAVRNFSREISVYGHISQRGAPFAFSHCRDSASKPSMVRTENNYGFKDSRRRKLVVAMGRYVSRIFVAGVRNYQPEKVLVSSSRDRRHSPWSQGMEERLLDLCS